LPRAWFWVRNEGLGRVADRPILRRSILFEIIKTSFEIISDSSFEGIESIQAM
jgi:hypothetical protein